MAECSGGIIIGNFNRMFSCFSRDFVVEYVLVSRWMKQGGNSSEKEMDKENQPVYGDDDDDDNNAGFGG